MTASKESYDWLGSGIYFWESDPLRAREWADNKVASGQYKQAFVIGAVIDLGNCLDATTRDGAEALDAAYCSLEELSKVGGTKMPKNIRAKRYLDCAVVNHLHELVRSADQPAYDTIRALFPQGERIYPTAGFWKHTHTQVCVINPENIKGVFRI